MFMALLLISATAPFLSEYQQKTVLMYETLRLP